MKFSPKDRFSDLNVKACLPGERWMRERIPHPWHKAVEGTVGVRLTRVEAVHEDFHTIKKGVKT